MLAGHPQLLAGAFVGLTRLGLWLVAYNHARGLGRAIHQLGLTAVDFLKQSWFGMAPSVHVSRARAAGLSGSSMFSVFHSKPALRPTASENVTARHCLVVRLCFPSSIGLARGT